MIDLERLKKVIKELSKLMENLESSRNFSGSFFIALIIKKK